MIKSNVYVYYEERYMIDKDITKQKQTKAKVLKIDKVQEIGVEKMCKEITFLTYHHKLGNLLMMKSNVSVYYEERYIIDKDITKQNHRYDFNCQKRC